MTYSVGNQIHVQVIPGWREQEKINNPHQLTGVRNQGIQKIYELKDAEGNSAQLTVSASDPRPVYTVLNKTHGMFQMCVSDPAQKPEVKKARNLRPPPGRSEVKNPHRFRPSRFFGIDRDIEKQECDEPKKRKLEDFSIS